MSQTQRGRTSNNEHLHLHSKERSSSLLYLLQIWSQCCRLGGGTTEALSASYPPSLPSLSVYIHTLLFCQTQVPLSPNLLTYPATGWGHGKTRWAVPGLSSTGRGGDSLLNVPRVTASICLDLSHGCLWVWVVSPKQHRTPRAQPVSYLFLNPLGLRHSSTEWIISFTDDLEVFSKHSHPTPKGNLLVSGRELLKDKHSSWSSLACVDITNGLGFCFLGSTELVSRADEPGSYGFMLSGDPGGWEVGHGGGAGWHAPPGWWQSLLPVGPMARWHHWEAGGAQGARGVATAGSTRGHVKFSSGVFSVHWVLLIPCPLSVFFPPAFPSLCACVF